MSSDLYTPTQVLAIRDEVARRITYKVPSNGKEVAEALLLANFIDLEAVVSTLGGDS